MSQIFFLIYIQFPKGYDFDEYHYVPAARKFLQFEANRNWEHPPLGKMILAAGIAVGGDRPFGWRVMSTLFGSLTLVGMYALGLVLFKNTQTAVWIALLTLCNQLLYVQARIGMLDTFMFGFMIWALVCFSATWHAHLKEKTLLRLLLGTGVFFGFSIACKWFAIVPWLACLFLIAVIRILQGWKTSFSQSRIDDWYRPNLWDRVSFLDFFLCLVMVPVWIYFLTFVPYLFLKQQHFTLFEFFVGLQTRMWSDQLRVIHNHPYMSQWLDWPLLIRPMWYQFDREGPLNSFVRGVMLLGNPLIMWSGLLALGICFWDWIRQKNLKPFLICYFYAVFFLCWAIIPRKVLFYYYYYPSGMMLSFALAYAFQPSDSKERPLAENWPRWLFLAASFSLFIYFFPILSAMKIPVESFRRWMWFANWI